MFCSTIRNTGRSLHTASSTEKAIIALGSNVGNRASAISDALAELRKFAKVVQTSFLYESPPMYVTNQPSFLNAVCEIETQHPPPLLLASLKRIESVLGRDQHGVRNGPRPIDLDIITFGRHVIRSFDPPLTIPHESFAEREFVLRPLCDISESSHIPQPDGSFQTTGTLLRDLLNRQGPSGLVQVTPTATGQLLRWGERTLLMGIINATPDSFSDGGKNATVSAALRQAEDFAKFGFDIIDIGGQSTRPGAQPITPSEELSRILPITIALHAAFPHLHLSADTFDAHVARTMVSHGASLINDVSGGSRDPHMLHTMHNTRAASILMHMRGTPATMQTLTSYPSDVAAVVGGELRARLDAAQRAGVPRWALLADCGLGFAKTAEQTEALVHTQRRFRECVGGFPTVLGASRKSWLKRHAWGEGRDWATAGAMGAAVGAGGVDVVRVHRAEVADAVRGAGG